MIPADEHVVGRDDVWVWVAPHPGDPRPTPHDREGIAARVGFAAPAGFETVLEVSARVRYLGEAGNPHWFGAVDDVAAPSPASIGRVSMQSGATKISVALDATHGDERAGAVDVARRRAAREAIHDTHLGTFDSA